MSRYIDADKLIAHLKDEIKECEIPFGSRANGKGVAYGTALGLKSAISFVETLSTADVVPKSEVERLQAEKDALIKNYAECMKDYAREIFEEIESLIDGKFSINHSVVLMSKEDFAELKKKYTEGE